MVRLAVMDFLCFQFMPLVKLMSIHSPRTWLQNMATKVISEYRIYDDFITVGAIVGVCSDLQQKCQLIGLPLVVRLEC